MIWVFIYHDSCGFIRGWFVQNIIKHIPRPIVCGLRTAWILVAKRGQTRRDSDGNCRGGSASLDKFFHSLSKLSGVMLRCFAAGL